MSEWISVEDRLPIDPSAAGYYAMVEVIAMDGVTGFACEFKCGNAAGGEWSAFEVNDTKVKVTHWMPLPEQN